MLDHQSDTSKLHLEVSFVAEDMSVLGLIISYHLIPWALADGLPCPFILVS